MQGRNQSLYPNNLKFPCIWKNRPFFGFRWIPIITQNSVQTLGYFKEIPSQGIGKEQRNNSLVLLFQNLGWNWLTHLQYYEILFKDYQKNIAVQVCENKTIKSSR